MTDPALTTFPAPRMTRLRRASEKRREGLRDLKEVATRVCPCNIFLRFASQGETPLRYAAKNTTQGSASEAETPQGFALRYDATLRGG